MTIAGPSVVDLVQHFCERWNFVKKIKFVVLVSATKGADSADTSTITEWSGFLSNIVIRQYFDSRTTDHILGHCRRCERRGETIQRQPVKAGSPASCRVERGEPSYHRGRAHLQRGRQLYHPYHFPPSEQPRAAEPVPSGTCRVQVLRSAADWSHGILLEDSIQQAYIGLIRESNHCIYIENQFFISACRPGQVVENQIGAAMVQRIISAASEGRKFKIIVVIPAVP